MVDRRSWAATVYLAACLLPGVCLAQSSAPGGQNPGITTSDSCEPEQVALARQYAAQREDRRASEVLQQLLRRAPDCRDAQLELALVWGYRGEYKKSDQLYRDLLAKDPRDEAAALGLVHNLIREGRLADARQQTLGALRLIPNSIALEKYNQELATWAAHGEAGTNRVVLVQAKESFFADTQGNRQLQSFQRTRFDLRPQFGIRTSVEERSLWSSGTPKANLLIATGDFILRPTKLVTISAGGGTVHFADQSSRALYQAGIEVRPLRRLLLTAGYSRFPIAPTYQSAQYDLLALGWHTGLSWNARATRISGSFSRTGYSDGNRAEKQSGELLHWFGGSHFAVGPGYEFTHEHFLANFSHGYFSPGQYRRHLAEVGIRYQLGHVFRAEYYGRGGLESVENGPFSPAGELLLLNRISLKKWELGIDYSRLQVAQSTGAFQSNWSSLMLGYRF